MIKKTGKTNKNYKFDMLSYTSNNLSRYINKILLILDITLTKLVYYKAKTHSTDTNQTTKSKKLKKKPWTTFSISKNEGT